MWPATLQWLMEVLSAIAACSFVAATCLGVWWAEALQQDEERKSCAQNEQTQRTVTRVELPRRPAAKAKASHPQAGSKTTTIRAPRDTAGSANVRSRQIPAARPVAVTTTAAFPWPQ
jgi:hypothetical protein